MMAGPGSGAWAGFQSSWYSEMAGTHASREKGYAHTRPTHVHGHTPRMWGRKTVQSLDWAVLQYGLYRGTVGSGRKDF